MCYDYSLLSFDEILTCETNHCNNTGCYKVNGEWICFECLSVMDGMQINKEIERTKNNLNYYKNKK